MALNINGTTGISGVDGSVSAPAVTGTDSNTGITFPAADTIKFSTGGVERMVITNSGVSATGHILQVVSTTKTDTFTTTSTSFTDVTGLSVAITPSSTSNKILVLVSMGVFGADASGSAGAAHKLLRDSTDLIIHSSNGAHGMSGYIYTAGTSFSYLDSPSSTSSITYKIQFKSNGGENFVTDNGSTATMTLLEVSQ